MNGCLMAIKESYQSLSKTEKHVADFFIHNFEQASGMTIKDVSDRTGVSKATIVRFARTLGFIGYRDFMLRFSAYASNGDSHTIPNFIEIEPGDSTGHVIRHVFTNSLRSIENTMNVCDEESIGEVVEKMYRARRIDFFGMGAGSIIAQDAQQKFLRINKISYAFADIHLQATVAASLTADDVCVVISYSGETIESRHIAGLAKKKGAFVVSITKYSENSISKIADVNLFVSSPETEIRSAAMGSRISQLCVIDVLYTAVLSLDYDNAKKYLDSTHKELSKIRSNKGAGTNGGAVRH